MNEPNPCPDTRTAAQVDAGDKPTVSSARPAGEITTGPFMPGSGLSAEPPSAPAVPGYEILQVLGRGGMGVVYQARQIKANRVVALKVIRAGGHASPADLQRFRTEAEAIAGLNHPHIVQIYEVGEHDGLPYFSLEYCPHGSLAGKLKGDPIVAREAATIVEQLARGMAAAHAKGIVHRDLKPANVLLAADGSPKITDFGLAKRAEQSPPTLPSPRSGGRENPSYPPREAGGGQGGGLPDLTVTGAIMGTPSYMAPEQASGESKLFGPLGDVYALGFILYECLVGRPPFKGASLIEALDQVRNLEPVSPRLLQPAVPRDLETICLKCLQKEPRKRYASAAELADDLRRFLDGKPIVARPIGRIERGSKWVKRNPVVAALLGAVFLASTIGSVGIYVKYREAKEQEAIAIKQAAIAKKNEENANIAVDERDVALKDKDYNSALDKILLAQAAFDSRNVTLARERLEQVPPELRRWEWYYLKRRYSGGISTLCGHTSGVRSVSFSRDGARIITASSDGMAKVWDARTGRHQSDLRGNSGAVSSVSFSPDGTRIVTGSSDPTAKVWDARIGRPLLDLKGHVGAVTCVSFSPGGTRIASGSYDHTAKIWDAKTGTLVLDLKGHSLGVTSVAFSPDGTRVVTGSRDNSAKIWNATTGTRLLEIQGLLGSVNSVSFSPDGTRIVTGSDDNTAKVWDAKTGLQMLDLQGHSYPVRTVSFSPDGTRIVTGSYDTTAKIWDAKSGKSLLDLKGHTEALWSASFSPDGTRIVTGSGDKTAKIWDAQSGTPILDLDKGHTSGVMSVTTNADGTRIVTGCGDKTAKVWDAKTGASLLELDGHSGPVMCVALSPNGTRIVTGCLDGTVKVWDANTGTFLLELKLKGQSNFVFGVSFSSDGMRIVTGSNDGTGVVWDAKSGARLLDLKGHVNGVSGVSFSPNGTRIVTGSFDQTAKVWDSKSGLLQLDLKGHTNSVTSVAFSPDGTRIVTGSDDNSAKVWDAKTGTPLLELKGHSFRVNAVSFSPDGTRIITASTDKTVKIWDAKMHLPDSDDEREYRLFWTRPRHDLHRQEFDNAIQAKDTFAARFHLDRFLAYQPQERLRALAVRSRSQSNDLLTQARTAVHSPSQMKPTQGAIFILSTRWDPLSSRLLGGLLLRTGKPTEAIPSLKLALALRAENRPPVEELLLALAYLDAKQPDEAAKWHAKAVAWLDRYHRPMHQTIGGLWPATAAILKSQIDPRYNAFDWETWYECEVFRTEIEAKLK